MEIPRLCGGCHREGTPVSLTRHIPQENILGNYMDSIHGEGLFKRGLIVTAVCTSCHTAHFVLPHTDPRSSIAKANIAGTCTRCHAQIEVVHRQVIRGELWEKQPHLIPACVDCHEPHKVRQVFYPQGMSDRDQRQLRELHEDLEAGGDLCQQVSGHRRSAHAYRRVHRSVLQSSTSPLGAGLPQPGGVRSFCPSRSRISGSKHEFFQAWGNLSMEEKREAGSTRLPGSSLR